MHDTVWMGLSAGSMVMTPRVGEHFVETKPPITGDDLGLGLVDFSIFPHLDYPAFPHNTMAAAEKWAAGLGFPAYAIDDETAIKWSAAPSKSSLRATGSFSPASRRNHPRQSRRASASAWAIDRSSASGPKADFNSLSSSAQPNAQ